MKLGFLGLFKTQKKTGKVSLTGNDWIIPLRPFRNNQDVEKTKGVTGIRTRDVAGEGLDVLHYAIRSLERSLFN